jgi:two-component system, OmpR family, sensor histidine kinase KdpD
VAGTTSAHVIIRALEAWADGESRRLYGFFMTFSPRGGWRETPGAAAGHRTSAAQVDYDRPMPGRKRLVHGLLSLAAVAIITSVPVLLAVPFSTTVAFSYLLVVLVVASSTGMTVAVVTSIVAALSLNFFFMPPVGTFAVDDPGDWAALGAFLVVAVVAGHLSSKARARASGAIDQRNEVARLFELSRDVLMTTDGDVTAALARHVARRFDLPVASIAVPAGSGGWHVVHGGAGTPVMDPTALDRVWSSAGQPLDPEAPIQPARDRTTLTTGGVVLVPVRVGTRAVGILALAGRALVPGTSDAIAGIVAIAIERARFLAERRTAELARQRADLSSALLASLGHDLRTPLTAIRVAVTNAGDTHLATELRAEQSRLALAEIDHLARLLQEILDLARIEAHAVQPDPSWVTPGAIVEAAAAHAGTLLTRHRLVIDADESSEVQLDPRLTSAALAHVLENAAKYSPAGTPITVKAAVSPDGLRVSVGDEGPGLDGEELDRLFEPFVRGRAVRRSTAGTGLGLTITRGLLAAEGGRIWAEAGGPGGARFAISVPAPQRPVAEHEAWS